MTKYLIKPLTISTLLFSSHLIADNNFYIGLKVGQVSIEHQSLGMGGVISDNDTGSGLLAGYTFNAIDVELEYMKANTASNDLLVTEIKIDTLALYGVYRSKSDLYFKAKVGFLKEKVTINDVYLQQNSASDSGLAVGVGGGYHFSNFTIEGEYTIIETDIGYLSAGINYYF